MIKGNTPHSQGVRLTQFLGRQTLSVLQSLGHSVLFLVSALTLMFRAPFRWRNLLEQLHFIGNHSLAVITLIGAFTGMVLALQGYHTLSRFGSEALLGSAVAISIIQELGPVLSGLMLTGRAGSALTSELGYMRLREEIDALEVMGIGAMKYLVVPRIEAGLIAFPLLTAIFDVVGLLGGYLVAVHLLGMTPGTYFGRMDESIFVDDILLGLVKSLCFGLVVTWICTYKGYYPGRGAKGVARSTTSAVVTSSVLILILDYFITSIML